MMDKDTASPPRYDAVAPQAAAAPPLQVQPMQVPQPTNMEAQVGYNYQLELMAKCARGEHQVTTKYGVVGIIFSVALFPIGMLALLCDSKKKCDRCGLVVG
ncbi:hypothetical protein DAEQUDRAFT_721355 [Daedalea quercina L-15889]|uniref:Uncharacterized protein n=1 Tax=Daedalea quercina L-15889 TaxID=1314783 RepID=A0A165TSD5_9APHY|nr:hypothetical protein DAEQUDRAFT_721355 [Daedalea quercina L-15889]